MTNRNTILLAAVTLGAALPLPATAQTAANKAAGPVAAPAAAPASAAAAAQRADFRRGIEIFRSFSAAVAAKNVKPAVKTRLIACLYANKLGDISRATGKAMANHPNLSDDKPADVWRAAAGVCGIAFNKPAAAAPAPAPSGKAKR